MGMIIAIDKLYMNKMPKSCKECPLTYLDTGDDAYFGANERRCVIDDSCIDGMVSERAYDCPLVEAIPKSDYESRLKADMVAMLTEIQLEIADNVESIIGHYDASTPERKRPLCKSARNEGRTECIDVIQQKINALKGEAND